ncbi:MAG: YjgN family protein [Deferribacterales bacterium]
MENISADSAGHSGFRFSGRAGEYFSIWIVNILLSIVTFGIYSAWAKVRRKRYFYGCTTLDGSCFEYLAEPKRILIGRIIVFSLYTVWIGVSKLAPVFSVVLLIPLALFIPVIINKALKFNAYNTSYRNVRFYYQSSYKETLYVFVLLGALSAITLGIMFPYYVYRIKKHIIEHSRYGLQHFHFSGRPGRFYSIYIGVAVIAVCMTIAGAAMIKVIPLLVPFIWILGYAFATTHLYVSQTNYIFDNVRLRDIKFRSTMNSSGYFLIAAVNYFVIALTLGLMIPWAKIRITRYRLENMAVLAGSSLDSFAAEEFAQVGATGEEFSDFFDFDMGL